MTDRFYARYQFYNGHRGAVVDDCINAVYATLEAIGITEEARHVVGITYGELTAAGDIAHEWDFGLPCPAYSAAVSC